MTGAVPGPAGTAVVVRLGVLLAGDVPAGPDVTAGPDVPEPLKVDLASRLTAELGAAYPGLSWEVEVVREELGEAEEDESLDLLEYTRDRMLDEGWDLAVGLCGEPLRQGKHTLTRQVSPAHSSAVVSLELAGTSPRQAVVAAVAGILGLDPDDAQPPAAHLRGAVHAARQLATDVEERGGENEVTYGWRVATSNLRLLLATIRANRPWTLAASLSRSLSAALATGALTLITTDLWLLSAEYNGLQMALVAVVAIVSVTVALVVGAKLWEKPRRRGEREQSMVFNLATVVSVVIGVSVLHVALFLAALAGSLLLVDPEVFGSVTGEPAQFTEYLKLAWFVGGLATIGSALGAGLEEGDDVRAAIFTRGSS